MQSGTKMKKKSHAHLVFLNNPVLLFLHKQNNVLEMIDRGHPKTPQAVNKFNTAN